ncbi:MAG TPA: alpha/beta hydrolase [Herpetosiphonaceae bacterium]
MHRIIELMNPGQARTADRRSSEANRPAAGGTRPWRWWARRTLGGLLLLVMVIAMITVGVGASAKAGLRASHPPIGQLVDVGGYQLHIACVGGGSPTVVLDAGAGDLGLTWAQVQPTLARSTRVCVYDRAGLGWSEPSPRPRTAAVMVDELHTLLANAGIAGPYVLVGHSLGGVVVRQYAHTYPADVAGIVLVDSAHEAQWLRFPQAIRNNLPRVLRQLRLVQTAASVGIGALKPSLMPLESRLPVEAAETARALKISGADIGTGAAELEQLAGGRTQPVTTLGDIPLIVLSASHSDPDSVPASAAVTPAVLEEYEQTREQLQRELAALSTNGKRIVADGSGHYVQLDRPDLVIRAIEDLLAVARS